MPAKVGRPPISGERLEAIRVAYAGDAEKFDEMVVRLGVARSTISRLARRHGWPMRGDRGPGRPYKYKADALRMLRQAYVEDPRKLDAVAYDLGTNANALCYLAKKYDWPRRSANWMR